MKNTSFNPDSYKDNQRRGWNKVSLGWEKWWDLIEEGATAISDRMLEMQRSCLA